MIIQPLWNKYILNKHLRSYELRILERELIEYKRCNGDIEYFTNGSGHPRSCTIC